MNEPDTSTPTAWASMAWRLQDWLERGWIRPLDKALALWLWSNLPHEAVGLCDIPVLLSHLEQSGHSCLDLADWPGGLVEQGVEPQLLQALAGQLPNQRSVLLRDLASWEAVYCPQSAQIDHSRPLVLDGTRLYLRRYWQFERRIAEQIRQRTQMVVDLDAVQARNWLERLFPGGTQPGPDWQKIACAFAMTRGFTLITGGPGTGKTYTAARLMVLLFALLQNRLPVRVLLAAPTGKAAARLKHSIEHALRELRVHLPGDESVALLARQVPPALTLHALLGARPGSRALRYHAGNPLPVDVLIVDEASMIHLEMMAALLDALSPQTRLILLGDQDQLASVEAGAVLGEFCAEPGQRRYLPHTAQDLLHRTGVVLPEHWIGPESSYLAQHVVTLQHSQRFGEDIGQLAVAIREGDVQRVSALLHRGGALTWVAPAVLSAQGQWCSPTQSCSLTEGYVAYLSLIRAGPRADEEEAAWGLQVLQAFDQYRLLCAVREGEWGVQGLNQAVQTALVAQGWIPEGVQWYEGRPVMVTRNDPELGLHNGDMGIVWRSRSLPVQQELRAYFAQGDSLRSVSITRLSKVETAFALTVHKSQGSEFQHAVLVLPTQVNGLTRELIYTAVTRARKRLTVVCPQPEVFFRGVGQPTHRSSGLRSQIDAALTGGVAQNES